MGKGRFAVIGLAVMLAACAKPPATTAPPSPAPAAVIVDSLARTVRLSVLGRYGRWLLVATEEKREGWIAE